jgi:hypothetical protein
MMVERSEKLAAFSVSRAAGRKNYFVARYADWQNLKAQSYQETLMRPIVGSHAFMQSGKTRMGDIKAVSDSVLGERRSPPQYRTRADVHAARRAGCVGGR